MENKPKYRHVWRIILYFFLAIICAFAKMYLLTVIFLALIGVYAFLSYKHRNDKYTSAGEVILDKAKGKAKELSPRQKKKQSIQAYHDRLTQIEDEFDFDYEAYENDEDDA